MPRFRWQQLAEAVEPPFTWGARPVTSRVLTVVLFAIGAFAALMFLFTSLGPVIQLAATGLATASFAIGRSSVVSRAGRVARAAALAVSGAFHALWIYAAVVFGTELAWTLRGVTIAFIVASILAAILTGRVGSRAPRVPIVLPLGLFIAACLVGWVREEWWVRCDDHLAATSQRGVSVLVPAVRELTQCSAGTRIPLGHYPRKVWEAEAGNRLLFTTQSATTQAFAPPAFTDQLPGAVCEAVLGSHDPPRCIGPARKSHGLVDAPELDRVFVGVMGGFGDRVGGIIAVPRSEPLRELEHVAVRESGNMFYDPVDDILGTFGDDGREMTPVRASHLEAGTPLPSPVIGPDAIRYDRGSRRGVLCGAAGPLRTLDGHAWLAMAVEGYPPKFRMLGSSASNPSSWFALGWGCDWDGRRVFAPIATQGVLATLDYDTGAILARRYVGFGVRAVTYERSRERIYLGSFLSGWVRAIDATSGREVGNWFAGRFVRDIVPTRDGHAILVTSSLGVVRIEVGG